jgi:hypothetical protein
MIEQVDIHRIPSKQLVWYITAPTNMWGEKVPFTFVFNKTKFGDEEYIWREVGDE